MNVQIYLVLPSIFGEYQGTVKRLVKNTPNCSKMAPSWASSFLTNDGTSLQPSSTTHHSPSHCRLPLHSRHQPASFSFSVFIRPIFDCTRVPTASDIVPGIELTLKPSLVVKKTVTISPVVSICAGKGATQN